MHALNNAKIRYLIMIKAYYTMLCHSLMHGYSSTGLEDHERISGFLQSLSPNNIKNLGLRLGLGDVNLKDMKQFPGI